MKKLLFITLILIHFVGFAQKIDKSKKDLSTNSTQSTSSSSSSKSSSGNIVAPEDVPFLFELAGFITYGVLIGDYRNEDHLNFNLTSHPFDGVNIGNYCEQDSISKSSFRVDVENHFLYNTKDLIGNHLEAKIRPSKYFYFQVNHRQLFEYDEFTKTNSQLSMQQFNFAYDRIRWENFNLGWTIGVTHIGSGVNESGFSYGLNAEYFLDKKISFLVDKKWSAINNQSVNSFKMEGNWHRKNYFLSLGFEHLTIGSPTYNFIALGGGIYF
jgi:hypothetical protein